jgi:hypothetical protein
MRWDDWVRFSCPEGAVQVKGQMLLLGQFDGQCRHLHSLLYLRWPSHVFRSDQAFQL